MLSCLLVCNHAGAQTSRHASGADAITHRLNSEVKALGAEQRALPLDELNDTCNAYV
jgi:hypothetical protein